MSLPTSEDPDVLLEAGSLADMGRCHWKKRANPYNRFQRHRRLLNQSTLIKMESTQRIVYSTNSSHTIPRYEKKRMNE